MTNSSHVGKAIDRGGCLTAIRISHRLIAVVDTLVVTIRNGYLKVWRVNPSGIGLNIHFSTVSSTVDPIWNYCSTSTRNNMARGSQLFGFCVELDKDLFFFDWNSHDEWRPFCGRSNRTPCNLGQFYLSLACQPIWFSYWYGGKPRNWLHFDCKCVWAKHLFCYDLKYRK